MNKLNISRALQAALIGIALVGSAGIARAEVKDYEFKLVEPQGQDRHRPACQQEDRQGGA
jgi:hypothetical protein